ncbi:hypothetical protein BY458DRAFT_496339 [Sporodiniella umbellata]|nr:hypothetical protein BY458DRAFT_496339 [Sporodiniella umbellata]
MASLNDTLFERLRERMKAEDFTEQEIQKIDQARNKLQMHTRLGAFAGATATYFLAKSKQFKPLRVLFLTGGGLIFGTQIGFLSGSLAGLKLINGLPNPQRVVNIMREIQLETVQGKVAPTEGMRSQAPQLPQSRRPQTAVIDEFSPEIQDTQAKEDNWENYQKPSVEKPVERHIQMENTSSTWDKIRSQNLPNNSWSKIRSEAQNNSMDESQIAKARADRANRLRERSEFEQELPRTREEDIRRTTGRKNQFGDLLE